MTASSAKPHHVARAHDFHRRWVSKFFGVEMPMNTDDVVAFCQFLAAELAAVERETARAASGLVEHALLRRDTNNGHTYCVECDASRPRSQKLRHDGDCSVKIALGATCMSKATPVRGTPEGGDDDGR